MASQDEVKAAFSGPIPGESLTHAPKQMPYEHPPQFTKLEDAMNFLMGQMLEPQYLKQLLALMDAGMPIEAITRTLLFSGFSMGKWTPDLGILMYKPLMLSLMAIAHKANMKHTPIVLKESLTKFQDQKLKQFQMMEEYKMKEAPASSETEELPEPTLNGGFMQRGAA